LGSLKLHTDIAVEIFWTLQQYLYLQWYWQTYESSVDQCVSKTCACPSYMLSGFQSPIAADQM